MSSRKAIFICHAYAADTEGNAARVAQIARGIALEGCLPLAPQLMFPRFLNESDPEDRELALELCLAMLALAGEVRVYGEPTAGMLMEIAEARSMGIPITEVKA